MEYTILSQQKCASTTCVDNEELLESKRIFVTPHFSELKKMTSVLKIKVPHNIASSNPFINDFASLELRKGSKTVAIIREPIDLLLSHFNQVPGGCMNIRNQFKNVTSFLNNIKDQRTFHPTLISTHYPLYDSNFKLLEIDYLLHSKNLDKFLKDNNITILERGKEIPKVDKKNQKAQLGKEIKMINEYFQFEKDLSEIVGQQTLFKVEDLPNRFRSLPEERIKNLIANMTK